MNAQMQEVLSRRRLEFARAVRNKHYEKSATGILFPRMQMFIGGVFEVSVNDRDVEVSPNIIPNEGLNHILDVICHGVTPVNPWYVAPFSGNVTPGATMTGASFTADTTEFTSYSEANRVTFNEDAASGQSISNDTNRAEFTITGSATIYGCGLLSTQAKSDATGKLLAASKFSAGRSVQAADTLQVKYTLAATGGS